MPDEPMTQARWSAMPERERAAIRDLSDLTGDQVAAALVRRAASNPRLAANLWRYVCRETAEAAAARMAGKNLAEEARRARAESAARFAAFMASRSHAQDTA